MTLATVRYDDESQVETTESRTAIALAINLLRPEVRLDARIATPLVFRDALMTLGDVVASRLYRPLAEIEAAVLDPLITVTNDDVYYEAFSLDESTYVRVAMREGAIDDVVARQPGCTNVEFSPSLAAGLAQVRRRSDVRLRVARSGVAVEHSGAAVRERKVELPSSWMQGFLEVQSALRVPGERLELAPRDLGNVLAYLAGRRAKSSPRGLRLLLDPAAPPRAIVQPWNREFSLRRSRFLGEAPSEVVVWGRRRLLLLQRLLPAADRVRVVLQGTGRPSFWTCDVGDTSLTLGLSPWSARDWPSKRADRAPRTPRPPADDVEAAASLLAGGGAMSRDELAAILGWQPPRVDGALDALCLDGRVLFDPDRGRLHPRRVFTPAE